MVDDASSEDGTVKTVRDYVPQMNGTDWLLI